MPWTVRSEDEGGECNNRDFLVVEFGSLPKGSRFPLASLIEAAPYHDTVLNPVHVQALIEELNLSSLATIHADLMELAKSAFEAELYFRFIGD